MSYTVQGGIVQTVAFKLNATSPVDLLVAKTKILVIGIYAAEVANATPALTIEKYDGTTSYYLQYAKPMVARGEVSHDKLITLKQGERLRAIASAANQIDVWVTYLDGDKTAMAQFTPHGQR